MNREDMKSDLILITSRIDEINDDEFKEANESSLEEYGHEIKDLIFMLKYKLE